MMKRINKKESFGITLIALVITIVVLIILAGVLINISLGNNGLFNKAKTAKEMYTNAQDYEETEIAKITNQIDGYSTFTRAGGSNINYSTEEQVVGTWINGETLYQKSYNLNTPSTKDHNTEILTLDSRIKVVNFFGMIIDSGVPINFTGSTSNWYSRTYINDNKMYQQVAGYLNTNEVITIQYTKTSD